MAEPENASPERDIILMIDEKKTWSESGIRRIIRDEVPQKKMRGFAKMPCPSCGERSGSPHPVGWWYVPGVLLGENFGIWTGCKVCGGCGYLPLEVVIFDD